MDQKLNDLLHELSNEVSLLVINEQKTLDDELQRISSILQEAVVNLRKCFDVMSTQISQQSAQIRASMLLISAENQENDDFKEILTTTNQISSNVSMAVRALQFEDIVQQLIGHSRHRIDALEKMFREIQDRVNQLSENKVSEYSMILSELEACQLDIKKIKDKLNKQSPVTQSSLEKGDFTLF